MPRKAKRVVVRYRALPTRIRRRGTGFKLKSAIAGAVGLMAVKALRSRLVDLGRWNDTVDMIATGAILKAVKLDNADLISAGVKTGIAQAVNSFIGGGIVKTTEEGV